MRLKKGLLILTKNWFKFKVQIQRETSTSFTFFLYTFLFPIPLLFLLSNFPFSYHNINQHDQIIRQYQKQIVVMQVQIQILVVAQIGGIVTIEIFQSKTKSSIDLAKLLMFNGKVNKVLGFLIAYMSQTLFSLYLHNQ